MLDLTEATNQELALYMVEDAEKIYDGVCKECDVPYIKAVVKEIEKRVKSKEK